MTREEAYWAGLDSENAQDESVTGWEWKCRWCGHQNRGTDSSLFCEQCGTNR